MPIAYARRNPARCTKGRVSFPLPLTNGSSVEDRVSPRVEVVGGHGNRGGLLCRGEGVVLFLLPAEPRLAPLRGPGPSAGRASAHGTRHRPRLLASGPAPVSWVGAGAGTTRGVRAPPSGHRHHHYGDSPEKGRGAFPPPLQDHSLSLVARTAGPPKKKKKPLPL